MCTKTLAAAVAPPAGSAGVVWRVATDTAEVSGGERRRRGCCGQVVWLRSLRQVLSIRVQNEESADPTEKQSSGVRRSETQGPPPPPIVRWSSSWNAAWNGRPLSSSSSFLTQGTVLKGEQEAEKKTGILLDLTWFFCFTESRKACDGTGGRQRRQRVILETQQGVNTSPGRSSHTPIHTWKLSFSSASSCLLNLLWRVASSKTRCWPASTRAGERGHRSGPRFFLIH